MVVTAAVPKVTSTVRNANVWTAHTLKRVIAASLTSKITAKLPSSKAMASAMTTTTLAAAIGTAVTVVEPKPTSNTVNSANAETARRRNQRIVPGSRKAVDCLTIRKTKTVTMQTTIANA